MTDEYEHSRAVQPEKVEALIADLSSETRELMARLVLKGWRFAPAESLDESGRIWWYPFNPRGKYAINCFDERLSGAINKVWKLEERNDYTRRVWA